MFWLQPFFIWKWIVWVLVKIYGIPLEYWLNKGLSYVTSGLKCPLYLNLITKEGTRLEFTRICIKMRIGECFMDFIDLNVPSVETLKLRVDYNWKPIKYSTCSCFGYTREEYRRAQLIAKGDGNQNHEAMMGK